MARRGPAVPTFEIDILIGFTGFFAAAFVLVTAYCEVTGKPALGWAVLSLGLVLATLALLRKRRQITHRGDPVGPAR